MRLPICLVNSCHMSLKPLHYQEGAVYPIGVPATRTEVRYAKSTAQCATDYEGGIRACGESLV